VVTGLEKYLDFVHGLETALGQATDVSAVARVSESEVRMWVIENVKVQACVLDLVAQQCLGGGAGRGGEGEGERGGGEEGGGGGGGGGAAAAAEEEEEQKRRAEEEEEEEKIRKQKETSGLFFDILFWCVGHRSAFSLSLSLSHTHTLSLSLYRIVA
jgi:hypothetical protein